MARITNVKGLTSKSDAVDMLRNCGLSKSEAVRFAAGGFKAFANINHDNDKAMQLAAKIDAAITKMRLKP